MQILINNSLQTTFCFAALFLGLIILAGCSTIEDAAIRGVERATDREVANATDRATTQVIRGADNAVRCAVGDRVCAERARERGEDIVYVDEDGNEVELERNEAGPEPENNAPDNVSTNYDFTPGDRVLFEEDFSNERVGDFPSRLRYGRGNFEVIDWNGQKLLSNTVAEGWFDVPLPEVLPDRFTLEFDFAHLEKGTGHINGTGILFGPVATREDLLTKGGAHTQELHVRVGSREGSGVWRDGGRLSGNIVGNPGIGENFVRFEIQVDGDAIKMYANQRDRIANVPQIELDRGDAIKFTFEGVGGAPVYIDNIRVAAGGMDLYSSLQSEGRVATRGILFETGSAGIQSGSTATLDEILGMLRQYSDLRLRIEGHTDNVGDASSNQALSQSRAEAVRDYLVEQGIDASRLEAVGMGEEHPVADNDTETGRAQNRRVELVRL